ncbi:NAD(P)-dependent alcohol dehydrogenase [Streptomyces sp. GbtcB7]|uniref:NAD(P)-dependent alcohol dehydrogenase n=1 Tax=Streptomyces sp. GbtcB7 TaxID=2824752 RepID=UPI001C308156|nr:NAD(P)-dependent alcohol dehydrogenase [Streptomyces sp. GbtcB7]
MRITAAVTESPGAPFTLSVVDIEPPRADEVLVRIVGAGVCHSDLVARDQWLPVNLPAVLGHEGSGVGEAVGAGVTQVRPGDHVILAFSWCGACRNCLRGRPAYCDLFVPANFFGRRMDGSTPLHRAGEDVGGAFFGQSSFAGHAVCNERNVVKVPHDLPLELLGPLGCGTQTGAGAVLNSLRPEAGSSIAVFGAGSVGISAVMAAAVAGCTTIVAVDLNDQRLALAKELGATHVVNGSEGDTVGHLRELTGGVGVEFTLETTGVPAVLRQAVDALGQGGTCGLIGVAAPGSEVSLDMLGLILGRGVRGISEGDSVPRIFVPRLLELYRQGRFPFDRLIRTYPLDRINEAVEDSEKGLTLKPVLTFP